MKPDISLGSVERSDLYNDTLLDAVEIAECVHRDGIIVFPGLVSSDVLALMNSEFDRIMEGPEEYGHKVDREKGLLNLRTKVGALLDKNFKAIPDFFNSIFMIDTTREYFGTNDIVVNRELFINLNTYTDKPFDKPPFLMHFDKREVFKFFLYLTDTSLEQGAMRVVPGSMVENRSNRDKQMNAGIP